MVFIDILVILTYFVLLVIVGIIGSKRAKTPEDYVVAGRNLGFFVYFGCLAAVILGGASTIGTTKLGYQFGLSGMWLVFMLGLGIMLLGTFLVKHISKLKVLTISEFLEIRFNSETRFISALVAAIYALMVAVTQVIGMGTILNVLLGWNLTISMLIAGGIVLFYTILGGMWSVTITDIIQFVIMTVGIFFIMLPISLSKAGGWDNIKSQLPDSYFSLTGIGVQQIFQYFLLFCLGIIVSQDIWQRVFTAKNLKIAQIGTIFAGGYSLLYGIAISIIGMATLVVLPNIKDPQNAFASMALEILPHGLLGIVLAGVMSALMSTASGALLASSTLLSNDIIKRFFYHSKQMTESQYLFISRIVTTVIGLLTVVFAIWIQDVIVALDVAYAILSGAIFVPILFGFFWKKSTPKAAFYSIMISTIVILLGLAIEGIYSTTPIIYGIFTSFVTMVILSLFTPTRQLNKEKNEIIDNHQSANQETKIVT
jgi:solute:Na+ symporter, SSS family